MSNLISSLRYLPPFRRAIYIQLWVYAVITALLLVITGLVPHGMDFVSNFTVGSQYKWGVLTAHLVHFSIIHLLCNAVTLYFMVDLCSNLFASVRRYIWFAVITGIVSGVPHMFMSPPAVGASGFLAALMAYICMVYPELEFRLFAIIPIRAKYLLWFGVGLSILCLATGWLAGIAHDIHLAGLVLGVVYFYLIKNRVLEKFVVKQENVRYEVFIQSHESEVIYEMVKDRLQGSWPISWRMSALKKKLLRNGYTLKRIQNNFFSINPLAEGTPKPPTRQYNIYI